MPNFDPTLVYEIASNGTEQMWIETDGTPYVYYTGWDIRELKVYLNCDHSASTPVATTDGDSKQILRYVSF